MRTAARCSAFILTLFVPCRAFILPESNHRLLGAQSTLPAAKCSSRLLRLNRACPMHFPTQRHTPARSVFFLVQMSRERFSALSGTENSFRSTSSRRAYPRRVQTCICTTAQWAALFPLQPAQRRQIAVRALCTCLPTSKYHRQALQPAGSQDAERRLAQKNVPGRKGGLPFSCSLPELWCCVESLGQRKANPASASLLTQFAERELHGQFRLGETARKCL